MGVLDRLLGRDYVSKLEQRCQELTLECAALRGELDTVGPPHEDLVRQRDRLLVRVENLSSALCKMLKIREKHDWSSSEEQAIVRCAQAILEDE